MPGILSIPGIINSHRLEVKEMLSSVKTYISKIYKDIVSVLFGGSFGVSDPREVKQEVSTTIMVIKELVRCLQELEFLVKQKSIKNMVSRYRKSIDNDIYRKNPCLTVLDILTDFTITAVGDEESEILSKVRKLTSKVRSLGEVCASCSICRYELLLQLTDSGYSFNSDVAIMNTSRVSSDSHLFEIWNKNIYLSFKYFKFNNN